MGRNLLKSRQICKSENPLKGGAALTLRPHPLWAGPET